MAKKISIVVGSPRKTGLTSSLATLFKAKIESMNSNPPAGSNGSIDAEIIQLADYKISHCTGCDACLRKPNTCPLSEHDDMGKIEAKLKQSDAIIMGAPSYFGSIPAIIKDIIDRSRPMKMAGYQIKDKIFSAYATAGLQGGGVNAVQDDLIHFALIQGMMVVGALGHPVLIPNLVSETLQMQEVKAFRKPAEIGDVAKNSIESLAERIYLLLIK